MIKRTPILLLFLFLVSGCALLKHGDGSQPAPMSSSPDTLAVDLRAAAAYRDQMDAALALYAFGDVSDFLDMRDSLRAGVDQLASSNPSIVYQPEFLQLVGGLAELDSLYPAGLGHSYLAETDSLALAEAVWPEADTTRSFIPTANGLDSPFPFVMNERIEFWVNYFTGPGRDRFERALYRMQLYRPIIEKILIEQGLHTDVTIVALIESGFDLKARSYAKAVGPWQFIAGTARLYGLRVDWWYDERRDIVASTYAAINYLKDLYGLWNDWPLALAAYNCGEYRVAQAMARQKTQDFWALDLPKQTERYVPKFLAALYIAREPDKYGFVVPDVEPVEFDEVTVKDATDLKLLADFSGTTADYIRDLNPNFLRWCTPPQMQVAVKVPRGTGDQCAQKLESIPPDQRVTWRRHQIKSGETLSGIATRYNTNVATLKSLNGIKKSTTIRAGNTLIVPVQGPYAEVASTKPQYREKRRNIDKADLEAYAKKLAPPADHKRVDYVVRKHDTLGEIAETHRTTAKKIRQWNNLSYGEHIYPDQKLVIYVPASFEPPKPASGQKARSRDGEGYEKIKYTVRKGDTLYSISRKFDVPLDDLLAWNSKSSKSLIRPGDVLEIRQKEIH